MVRSQFDNTKFFVIIIPLLFLFGLTKTKDDTVSKSFFYLTSEGYLYRYYDGNQLHDRKIN